MIYPSYLREVLQAGDIDCSKIHYCRLPSLIHISVVEEAGLLGLVTLFTMLLEEVYESGQCVALK